MTHSDNINTDWPVTKIYLNGFEQKGVVAFNTKEGWIEKYAHTDAGFVVRAGELVIERFEGEVHADGNVAYYQQPKDDGEFNMEEVNAQ